MKVLILVCALALAACSGDDLIYSDDPNINQDDDVCRAQGGTNVYLLVEVLQTGAQHSVTYCDLERTFNTCKQILCKTGADCPNNCD